MPRTRSVLAACALALAAGPLAAPSQAADPGCVTTWLRSGHYGPPVEQIVVRNPSGSVTIDPNPATGYAGYVASDVGGLVACIV